MLRITNNSIKHQSFVCTQLNDQTVLFLTIQFSICHLFALNLNVKQFYFTHREDSFRCYHFGLKWTWERWQWRSIIAFSKVSALLKPHHQIIQCHIPNTRWVRGLTPLQRCSQCIVHPQPTGLNNICVLVYLVLDYHIPSMKCCYKDNLLNFQAICHVLFSFP